MNDQKNWDTSVQRIRHWGISQRLPTSEGYLKLPNIDYPTRWHDNDDGFYDDDDGWSIEFFFENRWIKGCNIDFE